MKKVMLAFAAVAALSVAACGSDEKTVVVNPQPSATVVTPPPANNTVVVPQSSAPGTKICPSNTVC